MRILMAEDDVTVGEGLVTILESVGHEALLARTGPTAIAAADDGYKVVSCVRARHPGIRVVVLSAETDIA